MLLQSLCFLVCLGLTVITGCSTTGQTNDAAAAPPDQTTAENPVETDESTTMPIVMGAAQFDQYLPLLKDKKVGLVVNQTSVVDGVHIVDFLLSKNISVKKIFAPEHGFRGTADAGEQVKHGKDVNTGLPVISLYGSNKKPKPSYFEGLDLLIFDIQDVGARFYTYISTMHYVMEACAEQGRPLIVFDRPNPNGHYVAGPILEKKYQSFVGMHEVPVVHGMTVGEYARMINGERWLKNGVQTDLTVIPCLHYDHQRPYDLPIKPSPNLPNATSIALYPSLCFFEGTTASVGRGTDRQFQVYGHPDYSGGDYEFVPVSSPGAKNPKHQNKTCHGYDLSQRPLDQLRNDGLNLNYLIDFYRFYPNKENFFLKNNFFDKLAGTDQLRKAIVAGKTAKEIQAVWQADLEKFEQTRKKYLIYK